MRSQTRSARGEAGFALLLVYVMAAAIAITLYIEVPRIAFESQRTREQMTIDRALQYKRAIQLFYRKYQTYPQTLDDLETKRNIRFLRYRYLDPLTGKDYRLLHVGPAGQLTDSLVQPPAPLPGSSTGSGPNSTTGSTSSSAFGSTQTGATQNGAPPQSSSNTGQPVDPNNPNDPNAQAAPDPLNMALRRPSDRIIGAGGPGAGAAGTGGDPSEDQPPPEPDPNQPQQPVQPLPGLPVQQPGIPNQPLDPTQPTIPGQPITPQDPTQAPQPGQPPVQYPPGVPPSGPNPYQTPGAPPTGGPTPYPNFPPGQGVGLGAVPGAANSGGQQSATNLIQNILTTPRQPPSSITGFTSGNTGGIAGVASTAEGKGIHVINDRSKYKEWEFVYDLKKDKTVVGAAAVNAQQNVQQQMQQNQSGANNPFGSSSPASSPFNSTPTTPSNPAASPAPTTPPPSQ